MPNTGHFWTEDEDRAARVAIDYEAFCIILGRSDITYNAFRHRKRFLLSVQPEPTGLLARIKALLPW